MTKNTKQFNIIFAVDSTYMNESFWSQLTSDYAPFLARSFEAMDTEVSKQFVCCTRQNKEDRINASPWFTRQYKELQQFADSVKGSPCDFDIPEIFRYALQTAEQMPLHGLVIFAATQRQRSKAKAIESEIRPLAQRLKAMGVAVFIFDNADEYNMVSSHISSQFDKASMWANGLHVSFHSENLRTLYEYMKLIGPVVAGNLAALKKQAGDLITVHGNNLFRKCIIRLDPAGKK
jgi:hypothetical protein